MAHKHKDELIRWANSPEGTNVWHRSDSGWNWVRISPAWINSCIYIVDDEYAEVRKAYEDGKQIQVYDDWDNKWRDWSNPKWDLDVDKYRIKPDEPQVKELTMADIEAKYGCKVKIVKD